MAARALSGTHGAGRPGHAGAAPRQVPSLVHDVLASVGEPLGGDTRRRFEPALGIDLGDVRVHRDARAAASADAVDAEAYAAGRHIVFSAGRYQPGTSDGDWLIAHELAHVAQGDTALRRQTRPPQGTMTDAEIPAISMGGTRYRVLMGTAQCPGCHFGHGLEVDLYGQNFVEVLAMMAATGVGALAAGEPVPVGEGAPPPPVGETPAGAPSPAGPAGPPGLRLVHSGPGAPVVPEGPVTAGPSYPTVGSSALQPEIAPAAGPQVAPAPGPQLRLVPNVVPEVAPAPAPAPAAPPALRPGPVPLLPPLPMLGPSPAPAPAPARPPRNGQCPPNSHPVIWPAPIWVGAGFGDSGAISGIFDRPPTPLLTRVRSPRRNRSLVTSYVRQNAAVLRPLYVQGIRGAIHHKVPLYVGGPDAQANFVFLPVAMHTLWHNQLGRQGATGWMPRDPFGTVYCVL